jgi:hypothetical protein
MKEKGESSIINKLKLDRQVEKDGQQQKKAIGTMQSSGAQLM